MPLARGTAVVGYITLLGLFLAANMKVTTMIPKNLQVSKGFGYGPSFEEVMNLHAY